MIAAYSTALSGLNNASQSLAERAGRIAQSSTISPVPAADDVSSGATTALPGGGQARDSRATEPIRDPVFSAAGEEMLVTDLIGVSVDKAAFKANAAVMETTRQMEQRLLDMIA